MTTTINILFATSNPNKVRELRQVLEPLGINVMTLDEVGSFPEPEENAATFEENARLKAVAYAGATGLPCLAEDSGLEVDALAGAPGVRSARYADASGSREQKDRANNEKLLGDLARLGDVPRTARFVAAMCLATPEGNVLVETRGTFPGVIATEPRGAQGFGYDPLLYVPELGRTSAELAPSEKNARSHRGDAARQLADALRARPELLRPETR